MYVWVILLIVTIINICFGLQVEVREQKEGPQKPGTWGFGQIFWVVKRKATWQTRPCLDSPGSSLLLNGRAEISLQEADHRRPIYVSQSQFCTASGIVHDLSDLSFLNDKTAALSISSGVRSAGHTVGSNQIWTSLVHLLPSHNVANYHTDPSDIRIQISSPNCF